MNRIVNTDSTHLDLTMKYQKEGKNGIGKPHGLWYSIDREWLDWCKGNMDQWIKPYNIKLKIDESKMLIIETLDQLEAFCKKYEQKVTYSEHITEVNWEKVKKDYSGIEIRNYHKLKWNGDVWVWNYTIWFCGWDVSSGCIWDLSIITGYMIIKKQLVK